MGIGGIGMARMQLAFAACIVVTDCILSVHLKQSRLPGRFHTLIPHYPLDRDAVDLATFRTATPYQRGSQWNHMVYQLPTVTHRVGQIFQHARYDYLCAIVSIDPRPTAADAAWLDRMDVASLPHGADQPFYWCLVDTNDVTPAIMAYVPQDSVLQTTPPANALNFSHPDAVVFFDYAAPFTRHAGIATPKTGFQWGVATGSFANFVVGARVEVTDGNDEWIRGTVDGVITDKEGGYIVDLDGPTGVERTGVLKRVDVHSIRVGRLWAKGDFVEARWKKGAVWYPGVIKAVAKNGKAKLDATVGLNGCKLSIVFNDGDKEVLPASFVRFFGTAERARKSDETDFFRGSVPHDGFMI